MDDGPAHLPEDLVGGRLLKGEATEVNLEGRRGHAEHKEAKRPEVVLKDGAAVVERGSCGG